MTLSNGYLQFIKKKLVFSDIVILVYFECALFLGTNCVAMFSET